MAVHPFAQKLEIAVEHAMRALAALLATKDATDAEKPENQWWDWIDALGRKRVNTKLFGHRDLGALASNEQRVDITPGEALFSYDRKAAAKRGQTEIQKLLVKLAHAEADCARQRAIMRRDTGRDVSLSCPDVVALRKKLEQLLLEAAERATASLAANSGGGGGGGW